MDEDLSRNSGIKLRGERWDVHGVVGHWKQKNGGERLNEWKSIDEIL